MIAVTLNFKSIEAARKALLEIPSSALVGGPEPEPEAEAPKPAPAPVAASGKATAKGGAAPGKTAAEKAPVAESAEAAPPASTAAASSPAPAAEPPAASVDYPTLQKAVFTLAGKSREAAAAVAASFGVKTFKDLPADKWAAAFAAVTAKLAEIEGA